MEDIIKTFDQFLENSGKWVQAEVFFNGCEFKDIQTNTEELSISANVILDTTKEDVQTKLWIDNHQAFQFECSCTRDKPCMHAYGLYLYARRNDYFKAFESKIAAQPSLSLEEKVVAENLKKIIEIHYQIKEDSNKEEEERYSFDCVLIDEHQNEYKEVYIQQNMKILEGHFIFYSSEREGFYMQNNRMMKKILMVILADKKYSNSDAAYTKFLMDRHCRNIKAQ